MNTVITQTSFKWWFPVLAPPVFSNEGIITKILRNVIAVKLFCFDLLIYRFTF